MTEITRTVNIKNPIQIGIIGRENTLPKVQEVIKSFPSFAPLFLTYREEDEAIQQAKELIEKVEVILFTEYVPYRRSKESIEYTIPVHYIPITGTGLYSALYRLRKVCPYRTISTDTVSPTVIVKALNELGEATVNIMTYSGPTIHAEQDLLAFHADSYHDRKSDGVLTGIPYVAEKLTQLHIPNVLLTPTTQDISISLERALLSTETRKNKEAQIVVGIIKIDEFNQLIEEKGSEHEVQKLKLDIYRILLDFVKCLDGHLTPLGSDEYLFFTTRGIFERETGGYKNIPLFEETKKILNNTFSIGIGFGRSANEAGTHARLALRQAKESGGHVCFIVREDRSVIGPVEMGPPMIYDLSTTDEELISRAEKAGMTPIYLSKLMAQIAKFGKKDYTAHELASILGITLRSTHRILLQWLDAELVEIVGQEKVAMKGRPKQIFRLSFVEQESR